MKGESIKALKKIRIKDNGEPLVDIKKVCPQIIIGSEQLGLKSVKRPGKRKILYARKRVAKMLKKAQKLLPRNLQFKILDAWRPLEEQEHYYKVKYREIKKKHPSWSKAQLRKEVNQYVFPPDVGIAPYHTTGGAIDLTICFSSGRSIPMDSKKERLPTKILKNRKLLKKIMEKVGFTNYPFEWWHFSYGDSGWALRTRKRIAIYGVIRKNQK